ncbi:Large proline-rich protein [Schistosoma japonicum]|uniref:Large proline-rich protein n=1 Tax=Schistosoma japonicum TaxID=6182 RepID=A0A4Z2DMF2_SCHJA|nr:scythe/bat3 [Schistosoma japonicum]TNN17734.1 Large proline-rich protein [Schistosoma japonicum]
MFDVTVKTLDGRDSVFHIEDEAMNIENFKKEVEKQLNIAADQQRLIFQGRVLSNEQTLVECGVQGKVVHLVARPPPTTREQSSPGTTTDSTANISGSGLGGFTFGGLSMQQAIQDITSGILSGVSELSRAANLPLSRDGDLSNDIPSDHSLISMRENTFNKLHRQATRLTHKIAQISSKDSSGNKVGPIEPAPSPSTSHSVSQSDIQKADTITTCNDLNQMSKDEESSMIVDTDAYDKISPDEIKSVGNDEELKAEQGNTATVDASISSTSEPSLFLLADMLSKYRQLWNSIEPHLDHWGEMLRNESKIVETVSGICPIIGDSSTSGSTSLTSPDFETGSISNQEVSNWHPRLFSQVSRLLHLSAHMLHLISDFNVITMTERERQQVSCNVPTSQPSDSDPKSSTNSDSQELNSDANTLVDLTSEPVQVESKQIAQVKRCAQRVLSVPDFDRRRIRARISVEPPDLTIVATGDGHEPRIVRAEHPVPNIGSASSRIRSRSASNINRASNPQAESVSTTTSSFGTPNSAMTTTTTSFGNGRTAIIHRFDIPIISVNTFSLPAAPFLASLSSPITSVSAPTGMVSIPPSSTRVVTPTNDSVPTTHTNVTMVPRPSLPPLSVIDSIDPFLACNSRHFSHEVGHRIPTSHVLPAPPPLTPIYDVITSHDVNSGRQGHPQTTVDPVSLNSQTRSTLSSQIPFSFAQPVATNIARNPPTVNNATAGTRPPVSLSLGSGINLPQQLISLVSAATNAAISAVNTDSFTSGTSPFNLLVSSSPIQFSVNASHPVTTLATSITSTTTSGSTAHSSARIISQVKPSWASNEVSQSQLKGVFQIFSVLIDGLIKTVWSRISKSSSNPIATCEYMDDQNNPMNTSSRGQSVSVGLLSDILIAIHNQVITQPDSEDCGHITSSSLDGLREHLQHYLLCAESVLGNNQTELVNSLVSVIFRGRLSDVSHSKYTTWLRNVDENPPKHLVDITASFAKLCRYIVSSQLDLWRASPTNTGFGSTLLMTLKIACTDLLCLTDLLTNHLASSLGVELHSASSCSESSRGIRNQMFGITMGFETSLDHLNSFLQELEDDEYFDIAQDFIIGFGNCIKSYCDMDETTLRAKVAHQKSAYIEFRKSQITTPMMIDPSNGEIQRNVFDDDDLHDDDLPFLDAYSDLPSDEISPPILLKQQPLAVSNPNNDVPADQLKLQAKISALPDWTPKPGELPDNKITALDPNPKSTRSMESLPIPQETEGWHAVLPPAWIRVVTGDMSTMSRNIPTSDDPNQFGRFSDGYIAGMPAKRRKVMQEHSASLFQSPDQLFMECLSDAITSDNANKDKANEYLNNDVGDKHIPKLKRLPVADRELINSLRDIVSDRLAVRLMNDPDFDTARFPLATQDFLKRDPKARM